MSKHRKLILDIIMLSMEHMTAEEIFMKAKQIQPSIAVGTVYRNLGIMSEAREIRRISIPNAPDRYDKTLLPHEHIICQNCRELSDVTVSDLKEYIEKQIDIKILGYELNVKYMCDKCKKEEAK